MHPSSQAIGRALLAMTVALGMTLAAGCTGPNPAASNKSASGSDSQQAQIFDFFAAAKAMRKGMIPTAPTKGTPLVTVAPFKVEGNAIKLNPEVGNAWVRLEGGKALVNADGKWFEAKLQQAAGYRINGDEAQAVTVVGNDKENVILVEAADDESHWKVTVDGGAGDDAEGIADPHHAVEPNSRLEGGAGNDTLVATAHGCVYAGEAGDDRLFGSDGQDWLDGGEGNDHLEGGAGNDVLEGGIGDDFLLGEGGDDTAIGGAGKDKLEGGDGSDSLYGDAYEGAPYDGFFEEVAYDAEAIADSAGEENADIIEGGAGDDHLYGGLDGDYMMGDSGNDAMAGDEGDDMLAGGADTDSYEGDSGDDAYYDDSGTVAADAGDATSFEAGTMPAEPEWLEDPDVAVEGDAELAA